MEGYMVDNKLEPDDCVKLVQLYFERTFSDFSLLKKGAHTGFWWLEYKFERQNIVVYFDGDIGGHFSIKIYLNNEEYFLWQFDKSVNNKTLSNKENILYQLEVLKKFLM